MFSPERKVAKLTCEACHYSFSSKGNLSRHYIIYPDHRPEDERVVNSKEAVSVFLDRNLSPYHRRARVRELINDLSDDELVEALPRITKIISTTRFVYEKCKQKSGEICEKAVKNELNNLCENLFWTFPSIPRDLSVSGNFSAVLLKTDSQSPKQATTRRGMCTPDRRFLKFLDDRSEKRTLLEHLIISNQTEACETMLNCCNGQLVRDSLMPLFVRKHHEAFLEFGVGIVSSFGVSQNQLNSVLRGHWGKKLEEKTGLNPILPR